MKKVVLILSVIVIAGAALFAASVSTQKPASKSDAKTGATAKTESALLYLTIDELAHYNGQNGKRSYVVVDSVIYDVTPAKSWFGGKHKGYLAGKDISKEIKTISPHGIKVLKERNVVGKLVAGKPVKADSAAVPAAKIPGEKSVPAQK